MGEEKVGDLLEKIKRQQYVLPEFQREFVWKRDQTKEFMKSLFKGYPTGSLLIWDLNVDTSGINKNFKFKNDAADLNTIRNINVLLDGQQRLTTLYIYYYGEVPPFYREEEIKENIWDLYFNIKTGEFKYYKRLEMENDPFWIKVIDCFQNKPNVFEIAEKNSENDKEKFELVQELNYNLSKLTNIPNERFFPVQEVPSDCGLGEAIEVFDLINSQGSPLSKADIALAHMTESWPEIRRKFKEKIEKLKKENFKFDLTFLTRCMTGIVTGHAKFERIHSTNEEDLKEGWKKLTKSLDYLINLLKNNGYIYSTSDLNTTNVLVPIVVYISNKNPTDSEVNKLLYWIYSALLKRRYSAQTDQLLESDITSLMKEFKPQTLIDNLKKDAGEPEVTSSMLDMRGVEHPLYDIMCIASRKKGAKDWANGLHLKETIGNSYIIERHHIFPTSILKNNGYNTGVSQRDNKRVHEIANRVPLTKSGNMDIFSKPPGVYLPEVEKNYPGALDKAFVPKDRELWKVENYEVFLEERRKLIAEAINDLLHSLNPDLHDE